MLKHKPQDDPHLTQEQLAKFEKFLLEPEPEGVRIEQTTPVSERRKVWVEAGMSEEEFNRKAAYALTKLREEEEEAQRKRDAPFIRKARREAKRRENGEARLRRIEAKEKAQILRNQKRAESWARVKPVAVRSLLGAIGFGAFGILSVSAGSGLTAILVLWIIVGYYFFKFCNFFNFTEKSTPYHHLFLVVPFSIIIVAEVVGFVVHPERIGEFILPGSLFGIVGMIVGIFAGIEKTKQ